MGEFDDPYPYNNYLLNPEFPFVWRPPNRGDPWKQDDNQPNWGHDEIVEQLQDYIPPPESMLNMLEDKFPATNTTTKLWQEIHDRPGMLTSTVIVKLCGFGYCANQSKVLEECRAGGNITFNSWQQEHINRGKGTEPIAKFWYSSNFPAEFNINPVKCDHNLPLVASSRTIWIAATPDSMFIDDAGYFHFVEIKAPARLFTEKEINKPPRKLMGWFIQVMVQMYVFNNRPEKLAVTTSYLLVYTPDDKLLWEITYNDEFMKLLTTALFPIWQNLIGNNPDVKNELKHLRKAAEMVKHHAKIIPALNNSL